MHDDNRLAIKIEKAVQKVVWEHYSRDPSSPLHVEYFSKTKHMETAIRCASATSVTPPHPLTTHLPKKPYAKAAGRVPGRLPQPQLPTTAQLLEQALQPPPLGQAESHGVCGCKPSILVPEAQCSQSLLNHVSPTGEASTHLAHA